MLYMKHYMMEYMKHYMMEYMMEYIYKDYWYYTQTNERKNTKER